MQYKLHMTVTCIQVEQLCLQVCHDSASIVPSAEPVRYVYLGIFLEHNYGHQRSADTGLQAREFKARVLDPEHSQAKRYMQLSAPLELFASR